MQRKSIASKLFSCICIRWDLLLILIQHSKKKKRLFLWVLRVTREEHSYSFLVIHLNKQIQYVFFASNDNVSTQSTLGTRSCEEEKRDRDLLIFRSVSCESQSWMNYTLKEEHLSLSGIHCIHCLSKVAMNTMEIKWKKGHKITDSQKGSLFKWFKWSSRSISRLPLLTRNLLEWTTSESPGDDRSKIDSQWETGKWKKQE